MRREVRCRFHSSGRRVAVLDGGSGDHHGQQQAHRVHGDVPFPAVHFFRVIPAAGGPGHGVGGADGLGVDDRRGRLAVPAGSGPDLSAQLRHAAGPGCRHRARRRSTRRPSARAGSCRQVPPGAPGPVQIQDRLDDPPQRPDPRAAPPPGTTAGRCGAMTCHWASVRSLG